MAGFPGPSEGRWRSLSSGAKAAIIAAVVLAVALAVALPLALGSQSDPPGATTSPLTGLPGRAGRVLAVKIDNVAPARPQTGLNAADVVYAIEVEGGLSRLLAVYDSDHLPSGDVIGPVRSARESDLEVLGQYGKPAFAYSGAFSGFLPVLAKADLVNCSPQQAGSAYFRGRSRPAPHNEFVRPTDALRDCQGADSAKDIGFRFGGAPPGGVPAATFTARMPAASFAFTWSASRGEYLVSMDGSPAGTTDAGRIGAPTVVIQRVAETTSPRGFHGSPGQLSPFAPTVGSGDAVILRGGRAYQGRWSRSGAGAGTAFTFRGERMNFHPGRVWVVLEPR